MRFLSAFLTSVLMSNALAGVVVTLPSFGDVHWQTPVDSVGVLPSSGNQTGDARIVTGTGALYYWNGSSWTQISGGGGSPSWGSITGTLSNQTDLQNALDAKLGLTWSSNVDGGGFDLSNVNSVTATSFTGDGSGLTGVTATVSEGSTISGANVNAIVWSGNPATLTTTSGFSFDGSTFAVPGEADFPNGTVIDTGGNLTVSSGETSLQNTSVADLVTTDGIQVLTGGGSGIYGSAYYTGPSGGTMSDDGDGGFYFPGSDSSTGHSQIDFHGRAYFTHLIGVGYNGGSGTGSGAGSGSSLTINFTTDMAGSLDLTTGTGSLPNSEILYVNFNEDYDSPPHCTFSTTNPAAALVSTTVYSSPGESEFTLNSGSVPISDSTEYTWDFICVQ